MFSGGEASAGDAVSKMELETETYYHVTFMSCSPFGHYLGIDGILYEK